MEGGFGSPSFFKLKSMFPTLTYNVTDCCYLQILRDGAVFKEFNLSELHVLDKGDSFEIRDSVDSLDFSNYTVAFSADDLRTERCTCINS